MKENFDIVDLPENKEESMDDTEVSFASVDKILEENQNLRSVIEELNAQLKKLDPSYQNEIIERLLEENSNLRFEKKISDIEKVTDDLTGLKKRNFFIEVVSDKLDQINKFKEIEASDRRKERMESRVLSIVVCDIDNFGTINNKYGHPVGDEVLKKIAETLKASVRSGDVVCRWGGDEILILLSGADKSNAFSKADQIRQKVEDITFDHINLPELKVSMSMGVASSEDTPKKFNELYKKADIAAYESKRGGRNRVTSA